MGLKRPLLAQKVHYLESDGSCRRNNHRTSHRTCFSAGRLVERDAQTLVVAARAVGLDAERVAVLLMRDAVSADRMAATEKAAIELKDGRAVVVNGVAVTGVLSGLVAVLVGI